MVSEELDLNTKVLSRKKRSTATTVSVQQPEHSIQNALPSTLYSVAIAGQTKIGTGPFTNVTVQTGKEFKEGDKIPEAERSGWRERGWRLKQGGV